MVCGPRRIATFTLKTLKEKFIEKNIGVSMGTVLSLRPFSTTFATKKEMALCLCKICLNTRPLFEPLMCQAKKDKNMTTESITEFFMFNCQCLKSESGYFQWKCVTGKCHECKSLKPKSLDLPSSYHLVKFYQFEITETPYTKTTSDGKTQQKISRKCERVSHEIPCKDAYSKLLSMKNLYTSHKFEVYNDALKWPKVLETTKDNGEIYHIDFSEN